MSTNATKTLGSATLFSAWLLGACQGEAPAAPLAPARTEPPGSATVATASAPSSGPVAELAALDSRTPVPLLPMMAWHQKQNMMEHLVAIQRITDGLAREDWDAIAEASARIGTSPDMQQMCEHMGAGAAGFTALALDFHRRADSIGEAAREHDGPAVLHATSNTLLACTGCHAAFRQDIVDADTWQARAGQAQMPAMMHGAH